MFARVSLSHFQELPDYIIALVHTEHLCLTHTSIPNCTYGAMIKPHTNVFVITSKLLPPGLRSMLPRLLAPQNNITALHLRYTSVACVPLYSYCAHWPLHHVFTQRAWPYINHESKPVRHYKFNYTHATPNIVSIHVVFVIDLLNSRSGIVICNIRVAHAA